MRVTPVVAALLVVTACSREPERKAPVAATRPVRPSPFGDEFQKEWGDGKAEVAVYSLNGSREAISITFQEPREAPSSLRMNLIQRDLDGLGDRSTMFSIVISLTELNGLPHGGVTRVSMTDQSLTAHSWRDLLFTRDKATINTSDSAFGNSRKIVSFPGMRIPEDAMPLAVRRIAWPRLRLGARSRADILASLRNSAMEVDSVWMTLPADRETVETPAGKFRCHRFTAKWPNGRTKVWLVQGDPPYRIVRWQYSDGEQADLLGADGIKYWDMRPDEQEAALKRLRLHAGEPPAGRR